MKNKQDFEEPEQQPQEQTPEVPAELPDSERIQRGSFTRSSRIEIKGPFKGPKRGN